MRNSALRQPRLPDVVMVLALIFLGAAIVASIYENSHGHWEETGNITPARDDVMYVKQGDFLIPIPIHTPAKPELVWIRDQ